MELSLEFLFLSTYRRWRGMGQLFFRLEVQDFQIIWEPRMENGPLDFSG